MRWLALPQVALVSLLMVIRHSRAAPTTLAAVNVVFSRTIVDDGLAAPNVIGPMILTARSPLLGSVGRLFGKKVLTSAPKKKLYTHVPTTLTTPIVAQPAKWVRPQKMQLLETIPEKGVVKKTWYGKKKETGMTKFQEERVYLPKKQAKTEGPASTPGAEPVKPVDNSTPNLDALALLGIKPDQISATAGAAAAKAGAKKAGTSGSTSKPNRVTLADLFKHEDKGTGPFAPK
ncbi:hypothetical protein IE81DRAFT_322875 [Ceraceosorus guamensis]|uniref:Uncharacterized protein n=1 Tax=Ceraceosorus guamensis TaxID=1522189 RepID=A0A316W2Y6_9BASI|nr:hypothetical protein IE81DRAFT_322875 [Ceraceosorus guamensis]PWN42951.1 hypothetical protein IE81DRAFT_322875 [Ceraceosorus guamensis]